MSALVFTLRNAPAQRVDAGALNPTALAGLSVADIAALTLQIGKRDVDITRVEPVGAYAIKPVFSDGHDSGIYSWDYIYLLGENQEALWADYLARLDAAGASRDPALVPPPAAKGGCGSGGCGHHH